MATWRNGQHGEGERTDEDADRELTRLVLQDRLHDPRRELAHRQLDDHHRDRQHQSGQTHHRGGDRPQDRQCGVRPPRERARNQRIPKLTVDPQRHKRQHDASQNTQDRHKPQPAPHLTRHPIHRHATEHHPQPRVPDRQGRLSRAGGRILPRGRIGCADSPPRPWMTSKLPSAPAVPLRSRGIVAVVRGLLERSRARR